MSSQTAFAKATASQRRRIVLQFRMVHFIGIWFVIGLLIFGFVGTSKGFWPYDKPELEVVVITQTPQLPENYYEITVRHDPDANIVNIRIKAVGPSTLLRAIGVKGKEWETCVPLLPAPHGYGVYWTGEVQVGVNYAVDRLVSYELVDASKVSIMLDCAQGYQSQPFKVRLVSFEQISPLESRATLEYLAN